MKKRVGLLGGTFDPVHNGHCKIARSFITSGYIDELWILLTPYPPHKKEGNYVDYDIRHRMLKAAFKEDEKIFISTIENVLSKPSYTINTIMRLKEEHPETLFYFCLGEDSLEHFHKWKYYDRILDEVKLLAAKRPGSTHRNVNPLVSERSLFIEHEAFKISSSEVREKVSKGENIDDCVPVDVRKIIEETGIYKSNKP
jgi:nicotinate-nucleotide adenylyltransferase